MLGKIERYLFNYVSVACRIKSFPFFPFRLSEFNWNLQFVHYLRFVENKTHKNNEVYYVHQTFF